MRKQAMLFHEVHGCYFAVVAKALRLALQGRLSDATLQDIIQKEAFAESFLTLPKALKEDWPLLSVEMGTPLKRVPDLPVTILEKRWLKALMLDKRIRLFDPPLDGLEDVEPLFTPEMLDYFDRYQDGDPYEDAGYIHRFRIILKALEKKRQLLIQYMDASGGTRTWQLSPHHLEYSSRDDKFRLIVSSAHQHMTVNLARISACELLDQPSPSLPVPADRKRCLVLEISDERNAPERAMLHFSCFEKDTRRHGNGYLMTLKYDRDDEADMLIQVLSFGPMIRVISPESFISQLRQRLNRQSNLTKDPP